jgi:HK97 family phage major capsid protein
MADELIYFGDAIKAETLDGGGVKLGGYLVRFGDPSQPDLTGDYFTKSTDFGEAAESNTWFNHRLPVRLKKHNVQVKYTEPLPKATLKRDDVGIFAEVVIEARNEYEKTIAELGMAGKLAWSSGTASHLVDRKSIDKGVWEITRWPLGLDASLTPTPAEPRGTNQIQPMKSLIPSDDAPLSDTDDQPTEAKTNTPKRENKIMEEEIKSAVAQAVADALAAQKAIQEAEALKAAEVKAAEERGYKAAVEDLSKRRPVKYHSTDPVDDDNDGVGAFKSWMQTGQVNDGLIRPDSSWDRIPAAKAAWNVTTGASGAFLVPDPLYNQIIAKRDNSSWVRQVPVQTFSTPADHILVPREDTKLTDFVLTAEAAAYNENEGTVSQKDLILYKYTKLTKVNEEFLMYNTTNWESWFANTLGRAVAGTENTIYTTGTGTAEPEGVLVGATVANTTATTDVILASELTALIGYLGSGYNVPSECAFLMQNVTKWYLKGSQLSAGGFAYLPTPQGGDFFGYRAVVNDDMEVYTTASSKPILFGNFNYYGVVERPGMMVQRNPYLFMGTGQVGIYASIFRGGGVLQSEAFYYLTNAS